MAPKYKQVKPNELVRKSDEEGCTVNGKFVWRAASGHGFKVKDCMRGCRYRRKQTST